MDVIHSDDTHVGARKFSFFSITPQRNTTRGEVRVSVIGCSYPDEPVESASGCSGAGQQN